MELSLSQLTLIQPLFLDSMTKQLTPFRLLLSVVVVATAYYYAYREVEIQEMHCSDCFWTFGGFPSHIYDCTKGPLDIGMHFLAALLLSALTVSICMWLYKQLLKLYDYGISKGLKTFDFRFICFAIALSSMALSKKADYDRFDSLSSTEKYEFVRDGFSKKENVRLTINEWIENQMNSTIDDADPDRLMVLLRLSKRNDSFNLSERCGIWEPVLVKNYLDASKKFEEASTSYEEADDARKIATWFHDKPIYSISPKELAKPLLQSSRDDLNSSITPLKMMGYFGTDTCGGCDCKE